MRDVLRTVNFDSRTFRLLLDDGGRVNTGVTTLSMQSQENGENGHRADRRSDAAAQCGGVDNIGIDVGADGVAGGAALQIDPNVMDHRPSRVFSWRWTFGAGLPRS